MMRRIAIVPVVALLLGVMGGTAAADEPPVLSPIGGVFTAPNPCTGEITTLTVTGTMRLHQFENETAGVHHVNRLIRYEFETTDGFSGSGVVSAVHNAEGPLGDGLHETRPEESRGMQVIAENIIARNPETGEAFQVHFVFRGVFVSEDEEVVEAEMLILDCLGPA